MANIAKKKKVGRGGMIFLLLFALPFAGGGTFVGYLAGSMVASTLRAQSWEEVPATLLSTNLAVNHGDDSTTYQVQATYEYHYRGETYVSSRVGLSSGSDNIGSYHRDKYAELRRFQDAGRQFRAFVNPDDPSEAALYRDMRWGLLAFEAIFALVFSGVGYGLMFVAVYGRRLVKEAAALKQARPQEPWLWEKDWLDGRIVANARGKMIGALIFATLWNLISAPVLLFLPAEVASGNRIAAIGFIFPAIGLLLAAWAGYAIMQWRKFGNAEFEMFSMPGVLGGYLEGRVHTSMRKRPEDGCEVTLSCIKKVTTGSGKNRSTREEVLWQDAVDVPTGALLTGPGGFSVPIRFAIPYGAGPETDPEASDPVEWRLEVAADLPGIDFGSQFSVPVFKTNDSDPGFVGEAHPPPASAHGDPADKLAAAGIIRRPAPGGETWMFRRARAKGAAFGVTIFTAIWCGMIWLMIELGAPIYFPILFGLFALLMVWALLDMWLKQTTVTIGGSTLTFTKRFLGPGKTLTFDAAEIARIRTKGGMQAGNKLYYQVVLDTRDREEHALATQIGDQRLAKRIARELQAALGDAPAPAFAGPGSLTEEAAV